MSPSQPHTPQVDEPDAVHAIVRNLPGVNGGVVRGDYSGGEYIDITIGSEAYRPIEVIGVWSYETSCPVAPFSEWRQLTPAARHAAVVTAIAEWLAAVGDPTGTWYDDYVLASHHQQQPDR